MTDESKSQASHVDTQNQRLEQASEQRNLDTEALGHAHSDAQLVLEQTLESFSNLSDKAFRLIRLNGLVVTILVAMSSQIPVEKYLNVSLVASVTSFIASASFAVVAYRIQTVDGGIRTEAFQKLTQYKLREKEYLDWVLTKGYPKWIIDGVRKTNRKDRWIRYSLFAFAIGIVTLLAGTLLTLYRYHDL